MEHQLKKISFEELEKMKGDKKFYTATVNATTKEALLSSFTGLRFSKEKIKGRTHLIFSSNPENYVVYSEIIKSENCAQHTPISEFQQDQVYLFKVGDPYIFRGTIRGVYSDESSYLIIETEWGDVLMVSILVSEAMYIEIVPELKSISFEELEKMAEGKKLYDHVMLRAQDKEVFIRNLEEEVFSRDYFFNDGPNHIHQIITSDKENFVNNVEIVSGDCIGCTPVSEFKQDRECYFTAGDPYRFKGVVKGIFKAYHNYVVVKTSFEDLLLCQIDGYRVEHLQIAE